MSRGYFGFRGFLLKRSYFKSILTALWVYPNGRRRFGRKPAKHEKAARPVFIGSEVTSLCGPRIGIGIGRWNKTMPFLGTPGPGRPKGGLNKTTIEVRDASRALVEDPGYRAELIKRLIAGTAPHMETLLWHYAYGKPKDVVEILGDVGISTIMRVVVDHAASPVKRIGDGEAEGGSGR